MTRSATRGSGRLPGRLRWLFPTMRNVLIRRSLRTIDFSGIKSVLVVGAGDDPYRHLFPNSEAYVTSDVAGHPGRTDVVADAAALPFVGTTTVEQHTPVWPHGPVEVTTTR